MKKIRLIISSWLEKPVSSSSWLLIFSSVIFCRVFTEQFLATSSPLLPYELVLEFLHNFLFFLISFLFLWLFLSIILAIPLSKLSLIMLWASLLIIFPPLFDMLKTRGEVFWSFYLLSDPTTLWTQYYTFFGHLPSGIVYFGTKIISFLSIGFLTGLVYFLSNSLKKTIIAFGGAYSVLFLMGAFPSLVAYFFYLGQGYDFLSIKDFQVAQLFASPLPVWGIKMVSIKYAFSYKLDFIYFLLLIFLLLVFFWRINKGKLWAVFLNSRFPQLIYHSGLFFVGLGLGLLNHPESFSFDIFSILAILVLLSSIWLAWKASVVVNDLNDLEIDVISNSQRPLPSGLFTKEEYLDLGIIFFFLSLLGALIIGFPFFWLILVYQVLAWFYSARPLRLKRFPIVATFVSALASIMVLFLGYILVSPEQNISDLSWRITVLLLITYTISIPIKDFKDINGDKKDSVWTIPVIFGERKGRLIVAISVFASYMFSVFFLNEKKLFFWALLLGSLSFLFLENKKIKPRWLPGIILSFISLYLVILLVIFFLAVSR